jgi:hypothetical protein
MGEAKRRKKALGEKYGHEDYILPWMPVTKSQADQFVQLTTKGAWVGIALLVVWWLAVRFIGPSLGWWEIN